jgi:hypothetical protein
MPILIRTRLTFWWRSRSGSNHKFYICWRSEFFSSSFIHSSVSFIVSFIVLSFSPKLYKVRYFGQCFENAFLENSIVKLYIWLKLIQVRIGVRENYADRPDTDPTIWTFMYRVQLIWTLYNETMKTKRRSILLQKPELTWKSLLVKQSACVMPDLISVPLSGSKKYKSTY